MNLSNTLKVRNVVVFIMCFTILSTLLAVNIQAEARTITSNEIGVHDGYNYEFWKGTGSATMTLNFGGTFSCEWSDTNNVLFRKYAKYNKNLTHQQIGNIRINYDCNFQPEGNSYLAAYGLTVDPLVEYYIIESWGTLKPAGNLVSKGTVTTDGGTYDIYEDSIVINSIQGTKVFKRYWSVRQQKRTRGTISVSEHFKAWEDKGMNMGKMEELSLMVEGYESSGKADVTSLSIYPMVPAYTPPPTETSFVKYGDVNGDGVVNAGDYTLMRRYILKIIDKFDYLNGEKAADVNGDGRINVADYTLIRRYMLELIDIFPAEEDGLDTTTKFYNGNNTFALNIFKQISKEDEENNIFISPLSISTALSLAYEGGRERN